MRDWVFVASLVLARMAFGYQMQSVASMGPLLVERFGLDYAGLGTLIGLYMLPGIVVALPGGLLGRRFGGRKVVGVGLALMAVGGAVGAVWFGVAGMGAGRTIAGVGAVLLIVMQGQMVSDRFPGARFMPVMSLLVGAFPVGVGLAGLSGGWLLSRGPGGMLWAGAGIAALSWVLFVSSAEDGARAGARWSMPSRRESVLVVVAGLVWTAYNAGYYGFLSYLPSLLGLRGYGPGLVGLVMAIATWTNLPAMFAGGAAASRWGNGPVFLAGSICGVAAVVGSAVLDWPLVWGVLFGTLAAVHPGVIIGVGTLSARPENRAVGMGLFYTTYYIGGTVAPALCGHAADAAGTPAGALLAAAGLAAMAVPFYFLHAALARRLA